MNENDTSEKFPVTPDSPDELNILHDKGSGNSLNETNAVLEELPRSSDEESPENREVNTQEPDRLDDSAFGISLNDSGLADGIDNVAVEAQAELPETRGDEKTPDDKNDDRN